MGGPGSGPRSHGGGSHKASNRQEVKNRVKQLNDAAKRASKAGNHQLAVRLRGKAHATKLKG